MFTEDPTLPVGALLMAAACCFVALRARQEGKYLAWGASALACISRILTTSNFAPERALAIIARVASEPAEDPP